MKHIVLLILPLTLTLFTTTLKQNRLYNFSFGQAIIKNIRVNTKLMKRSQLIRQNFRNKMDMKKEAQNMAILPKQSNLLFALMFLMTLGIFSCSPKQSVQKSIAPAQTLISYTKLRSRGNTLPLYNIDLLDSKAVKYTGIANVPVLGERIIDMDAAAYNAILQQFEASNFKQFKEMYKSKMRDLPLSRITFNNHTVTYQEAACPAELKKLAALIENLGSN